MAKKVRITVVSMVRRKWGRGYVEWTEDRFSWAAAWRVVDDAMVPRSEVRKIDDGMGSSGYHLYRLVIG
jgi:hypothetical protein